MTAPHLPIHATESAAASTTGSTPPSAAPRAIGRCTLVGAGPGDPELLTLKAVKAIASASVLLVDDLVNDAVLAYASPTARIVHVGKRGGCKSTP
ncbi:MAG: Uroporphyrinogen-III C-methyltransferase, partial [Pseudomonadota bacterium]